MSVTSSLEYDSVSQELKYQETRAEC